MNVYLFVYNDNDSRRLAENDEIAIEYAKEELRFLHEYHSGTCQVEVFRLPDGNVSSFVCSLNYNDL